MFPKNIEFLSKILGTLEKNFKKYFEMISPVHTSESNAIREW